MADDQERGGPEDLGQDPFGERLRPDPSQPPEPVRTLRGVLGDSDREGYKRLYFTRELDHYAEFRAEDVIFTEVIPPDQPPFLGQQATRVGIRRDATLEYTRVRTPKPVDEFDLDIRLGALGGQAAFLVADCTHNTGWSDWACDPCVTPACPTPACPPHVPEDPHIPVPWTRTPGCQTNACTPAGATPCCPQNTEGAGPTCGGRCWTLRVGACPPDWRELTLGNFCD